MPAKQISTKPIRSRIGSYVTTNVVGETVKAYIPVPLPPNPPVDLRQLHGRIDRADRAVGRLDGLSSLIPDANLLLYAYVRKEAVLSSQIEGTQSSLSELLLFENDAAPGVPIDDVEEVSNYVAAMQHGLRRLCKGFPLSLRLIREMHAILLRGGRGSNKTPGEFRRSQNWIGGTRPGNAAFVPPPPNRLMECLDPFEKFLHDDNESLPLLVKLGLIHVQFETIHPFLDGNGRLGRLLITLLLCEKKALREPLLYLSLFFKTHREHYYALLQRVRTEGAWEDWLAFFLEGIESTAGEVARAVKRSLALFAADRKRIGTLGRASFSALRVQEYMQKRPIANIGAISKTLSLSVPTVTAALQHLSELGITKEMTGGRRNRVFSYTKYLAMVAAGTEPIR
jgi:cell filamentation protein, protein adenylyltransferase